MSSNTKKIFIDTGPFIVLLLSWWAIGMSVAQEAGYHVEQQFESPFLKNLFYNDWLPIITAVAWGTGWGIALLGMRNQKSLISLRWFFLISIPPLLYLLISIVVRSINHALVNDLIDPSLSPFQEGITFGSIFAVLQNMKKDSDG